MPNEQTQAHLAALLTIAATQNLEFDADTVVDSIMDVYQDFDEALGKYHGTEEDEG